MKPDNIPEYLAGTVALSALCITSYLNGLLFHSLLEFLTVSIAFTTFSVAWNVREFLRGHYFLFIGIAWLFTGFTDLLHTLAACQGMKVFDGYGGDLPAQIHLVARCIEIVSLWMAPDFLDRPLRFPRATIAVFTVLTGTACLAVFSGHFPACFRPGTGITPFRTACEYILLLILVMAWFRMYHRREHLPPEIFRSLTAALIFTALAGSALAFHDSTCGISGLAGHFSGLAACYLFYRALLKTGLTRPYKMLYQEIQTRNHEIRECRMNAETSLWAVKAQWRSLAENIPDMIFRMNRQGHYTYINGAARHIFGIEPAEFTDRNGRAVGLPESWSDSVEKTALQVFRDGVPRQVESGIMGMSGILILECRLVPEKNPQNEILSVLAVVRDITERKNAEAALKESEFQKRALLDTIPDMAWLKDRLGRFIAVNRTFAEVCGKSPEELRGKGDFDIWSENAARNYMAEDIRVMQSGQRMHIEGPLKKQRTAGGKWYETIKSPVFDERGEVAGISGIARDITRWKETETLLIRSEERFRAIYETSFTGIQIYDDRKLLTHINPACMGIFGISNASHAMGTDLFTNFAVPPSEMKLLEQWKTVRYETVFDFSISPYPTVKTGKININVTISPTGRPGKPAPESGWLVQVQETACRKTIPDIGPASVEKVQT